MEHLFKLKKDGKTVGHLRLKDGWTQFQILGRNDWYYPCDMKWTSAHSFVCKDKNSKDVFAGDRVSFWLIGCPDRATGIIKWQQESHRFVFVEDSTGGSGWGFTDKNDIESIEGKENETT